MKHQTYAVVLSALIGLFSLSTQAQHRRVNNTLLLPELQAEYALKGDDYLLLRVQGPSRTGGAEGTQLNQLGVQLTYERFWSTQWSGGASLRTTSYKAFNGAEGKKLYVDVTPELYLRHWNTWGSYNFRQRLGAEYTVPADPLVKGRAMVRLRLDVDRVFTVGKLALRPRVAYEALAYLRLQRAEDESRERVVDFGELRADLGVRFSPHFDLTPWISSNTAYRILLEQTDVNGKVVIPGGNYNSVTPVVGLDIRYTIFRGQAQFERRQLPTQH